MQMATRTEMGGPHIPLFMGAEGDSGKASKPEYHVCLGTVKWDSSLAKKEMASIWHPVV